MGDTNSGNEYGADPAMIKRRSSIPVFMQDESWREELTLIIRSVVSEELKSYNHECRFSGVSDKDTADVVNAIHMITDLGKGKFCAGVDVVRDNHKWLKTARERSDKVSTAFLLVITTSIVTGTLYAMWEGVKHFVRR